ncbi:hypothetical protein Cadr_000023846 [Camelus dromedarius]|uniref:Uncharacterized protein n=1 Tax=Camelus dromedarius TaxID=9838 RepID=A0A5N4CWN5_CAMDR|nr:hypothetical protein Cadr_000023846 [Camelus dromedarius]
MGKAKPAGWAPRRGFSCRLEQAGRPEAQQQLWFWEGKGGLTLALLWLALAGDFWMAVPAYQMAGSDGGRVCRARPPTVPAWQSQSFQTPGWEGDPQGRVPGTESPGLRAQGPPTGRTWPLPLETPKLGRGARRAQREVPINTKQGGSSAPPRTGSVQAGTPGFHRKQLLAATKHLQLLLRKEKKNRDGRSCLKGLRLPRWAWGPPTPHSEMGRVAPAEPTKAGWAGELRAPRGINRGGGTTAAALGAAQTRDLVVLQRELVVVGDLLIHANGLLGVDHDLLLGLDGDHLGVAVGLQDEGPGPCPRPTPGPARPLTHRAAVVDEPCQVTTLGGIDDGVVVHPEQRFSRMSATI